MERRGRARVAGGLVLAVAVAAAGCGGSSSSSASCADPPSDSPVYAATAPRPTADAVCDRAQALRLKNTGVKAVDAKRIAVSAPGSTPATRAALLSPFQIRFYDFEPNVYSASKPGARDTPAPFGGLFPAAAFAAKQKPRAEPEDVPPGGPSAEIKSRFGGDQAAIQGYYDRQNDSAADKYYVFGPGAGADRKLVPPGTVHGEPLGSAYGSCQDIADDYRAGHRTVAPTGKSGRPPRETACGPELAALGNAGPPPGSTVVKVPRGVMVVADQQRGRPLADSTAAGPSFVMEDDAELTGSDITDPKRAIDPVTNEPNVSFRFTDDGKAAFKAVTKRVAQRGLQTGSNQNFAITLDDQIVSRAFIDGNRYPQGIDGSTGAQISGVGTASDATLLAAILKLGPLPGTLRRTG